MSSTPKEAVTSAAGGKPSASVTATILRSAMSRTQFCDAINRLGLSQRAAARFFGRSGRQAQCWANGWSPVPKSVAMLLELMLRYGLKPKDLKASHRNTWASR